MRRTRDIVRVAVVAGLSGLLLRTAPADGVGSGKARQAGRAVKSPVTEPYTWRNVEIVGGGFVSGIVFSPKQPNLIYARTDIGGAYRWNPAAKRWIPLTDWVSQAEANLLGIESLAADPTDAKRLYAAVGTYTQSWAGNGAILRSTDQGRTWRRTAMPFKMGGNEDGRSIGERLSVDPNQNRVLYFGSRHDGLWKSDDYAATWRKVERFPVTGRTNGIGIGFVVYAPRSGSPGHSSQMIYVGVDAPGVSLYRSADGGATWEVVPGQPQGLLPHHGVFDSDGTLYLTYGNGPGPNGMTDGAVWKLNPKTGAWTNITPVAPGSEGAGRFGYAGLSVDAAHSGTLMVSTMDKWSSGDDIFRSVDGGTHWTALKLKAVRDSSAAPFLNWNRGKADLGHWIGCVAIDPFQPGHVLYVTGATIWGSDDVTAADKNEPTHWTVRAQGLEETAVIDLVSPPAGAHLLSGLGDIGGFRHDDLTVSPRGGIWTNPLINNTDSLDFAEGNPSIVARVGRGEPGRNGGYSTDGGATWAPFPTEPGGRGAGVIAVAADGSAFVWTPRDGMAHITKDRGLTWTACQGLANGLGVVADRVNPRRFYALDAKAGTLYVSADGGANFTAQAVRLPAGRSKLRAVPGKEGEAWVANGDSLLHLTDGGMYSEALPNVQEAYAIGFGKAAPGQTYPALYLAGKADGAAGIFRSDNGGATWVRINDDQHQYGWIGQVITGDPRLYGRVYLGTNGRGVLYADPARSAKR